MLDNKILLSLLPLIIANGIMIFLLIVFAFVYPRRERTQEVVDKMHPTFIGVFLMEYWYWLTSPFIRLFILFRMTPNMLTGISLIISLFSGYFYMKGDFALGGWLLIINGALDTLDGKLARTINLVTREGAFFDSCSDRYAEGFVLMGIALYFRNSLFLLSMSLFALIGSQLVSYAKARGEAVGVTTKKGLMQRTERVFLIAIVSVFTPFLGILLSSYNLRPDIPIIAVIVILAVMTNYTAAVRIVVLFNELKRGKS